MQHADQKYINALVNNDKVLIGELYQKCFGKIKWMLLRNNGTLTDAADIFQDVLLSIYKRAKNQNFTLTCPLDSFLYVCCKNRWMSELNRKKLAQVTITGFSVSNIHKDSFLAAEEFKLQRERKDLLTEKLAE